MNGDDFQKNCKYHKSHPKTNLEKILSKSDYKKIFKSGKKYLAGNDGGAERDNSRGGNYPTNAIPKWIDVVSFIQMKQWGSVQNQRERFGWGWENFRVGGFFGFFRKNQKLWFLF